MRKPDMVELLLKARKTDKEERNDENPLYAYSTTELKAELRRRKREKYYR